MKADEWRRAIPGFPNYAASADGDIWVMFSGSRRFSGRVPFTLRTKIAQNGHRYVGLTKNGHVHWHNVSRLITLAFHGEPPTSAHMACHRDGNPLNNFPFNLYWGTHEENMMDKRHHGRAKGSRNPYAILKESDALAIKQRLTLGLPQKEIATEFGISVALVCAINTGRLWSHVVLP